MLRTRLSCIVRSSALPKRQSILTQLAHQRIIIPSAFGHRISTSRALQTLETDPKKVTTTSTTTPIVAVDEGGGGQLWKEIVGITDIVAGIPRPALLVGLAGTLPYLGTSLGSLYLSWCMTKEYQPYIGSLTDKMVLFNGDSADHLLHILQPIQVGYGACILSFLGAIHWGLEIAGYNGNTGIRRYALGAIPTLVAWPSILLPTDVALVTQFLGFTAMWFADSRAATNGWTPPWYNEYRFVLTFVVCTSILFTLIVSGWLGESQHATPLYTRMEKLRDEKVQAYYADEERVNKSAEKAEKKKKRPMDGMDEMASKAKDAQVDEEKHAEKLSKKFNESTDEDTDGEEADEDEDDKQHKA